MADGFGGAGYIDPVTGEWVSTPGTGLNGMPTQTATPGSPGGPQLSTPQGGQLITTPNSSTGQPLRQAPSASTFQPPTTQTRPGLLTPNSRTGAPGYQVPTVNPMTLPGALGTGIGALLNAPTTDQGLYDNANRVGSAVDSNPVTQWMIQHGWLTPSPKWGPPAPAAAAPSPTPVTQTGPGRSPSGPTPPPPPPDITLPPFNVPPPPPPGNSGPRGPLPAYLPQTAPRAPRSYNLGYGAPTPAAAPAAPSPMFTAIDRPNADVVGGRSVAGQLAPQYFNPAREPGGPAQMGALDLSRLFARPAAQPPVQGALSNPGPGSAVGAPNIGNGRSGVAQAPMMRRQPFFANPRNWQYPNMPF